jgi:RND family efflux transporter MFP subunit
MKRELFLSVAPVILLASSMLVAQEAQLPEVRVATIGRGAVTRSIDGVGVLTPWKEVTIASQGSGAVTAVRCQVGQWVDRNEVLVELDDELARVAVSEAEADLRRAEAQQIQAATDVGRAEQLLADEDISESEWELLKLRHHEAVAAVAAAGARHQRAERALRDTRVRAPFAGVVARREVEVGSWLSPGQPVVRLVDLGRMKAEFGIPQQRTPEVAAGMEAELTIDLYPGVTFAAEVLRVGVVADPASGQFLLEVAVPQSRAHPLRPGMAARLHLETSDGAAAILVPKEAIIDRGGAAYVLVVDDQSVVRMRAILVGAPNDGFRELLDRSLSPGDRVVTRGKDGVTDGDRVRVGGSPSQ